MIQQIEHEIDSCIILREDHLSKTHSVHAELMNSQSVDDQAVFDELISMLLLLRESTIETLELITKWKILHNNKVLGLYGRNFLYLLAFRESRTYVPSLVPRSIIF